MIVYTNKIRQIVFNILVLALFLAPSNSIGYSSIIVLFSLYFAMDIRINSKLIFLKISFILLVLISLTLNVNTYLFVIQDFIKIFLLSFLILFFNYGKPLNISTKVIISIYIILFISQISYAFGFSPIILLIDSIYPMDERYFLLYHRELDFSNLTSGSLFRFGGIYRNPNQFGKYLNILYLMYIFELHKKAKTISIYVPSLLLLNILLTGGRTSFVVFTIITSFVLWNKISVKGKVLGGFIILIFSLYFLKSDVNVDISSVRAISFENEGVDKGSFSGRTGALEKYFSIVDNPVNYIFGNFITDKSIEKNFNDNDFLMFDSDLGNIIFSYGFIGLFILILFFFSIFIETENFYRIAFVIVLFSATAGILFDFKFSILFMVLLSNYTYNKKFKLKNSYLK